MLKWKNAFNFFFSFLGSGWCGSIKVLLPLTFLEQSSSGCRILILAAMTHLCSPYLGERLAAPGVPFSQEKAKSGPKQIRVIPEKQRKITPPQNLPIPPQPTQISEIPHFLIRFPQATGAFSIPILGFWGMDKVTVRIVMILGLFLCFFGIPPTSQPVCALPNAAFSPRGGFILKHRPNPSAKTSLISCVGAKPN